MRKGPGRTSPYAGTPFHGFVTTRSTGHGSWTRASSIASVDYFVDRIPNPGPNDPDARHPRKREQPLCVRVAGVADSGRDGVAVLDGSPLGDALGGALRTGAFVGAAGTSQQPPARRRNQGQGSPELGPVDDALGPGDQRGEGPAAAAAAATGRGGLALYARSGTRQRVS